MITGVQISPRENRRAALFFFALAMCFFCFGCRSLSEEGRHLAEAKRAAKNQAYGRAIASAAMALHLDPEYKQAILFLDETFPRALDWYYREIAFSRERDDVDSLDRAAGAYGALVEIADSLKLLAPLVHPETGRPLVYQVDDHREDYRQAALRAAEAHYRRGLEYLAVDGREAAINAVRDFTAVLEYLPAYKDAQEMAGRARERATLKAAFLPFAGRMAGSNGLDLNRRLPEMIFQEIVENESAQEFLAFIEPSRIHDAIWAQGIAYTRLFDDDACLRLGGTLEADLVLAGTIQRVDSMGPRTVSDRVVRTAEITATGEDVSAGLAAESGERIRIQAELTIYEAAARTEIALRYKLLDVKTRRTVFSQTESAASDDRLRWADNLEGDPRALLPSDRSLLNEPRRNLKSIYTLMEETAETLARDIGFRLKPYLK